MFDKSYFATDLPKQLNKYSECSCDITLRNGLTVRISGYELTDSLATFRIYPPRDIDLELHDRNERFDTIVVRCEDIFMIRLTAKDPEKPEPLLPMGFDTSSVSKPNK